MRFSFSALSAWSSATSIKMRTAGASLLITASHQDQAQAHIRWRSSVSFLAPRSLATTVRTIFVTSVVLLLVALRSRLLTSLAVLAAILHVMVFHAAPDCASATSPRAGTHLNVASVLSLTLAE